MGRRDQGIAPYAGTRRRRPQAFPQQGKVSAADLPRGGRRMREKERRLPTDALWIFSLTCQLR